MPPYNKPSQEGLYRHFRAIAEGAPDLACMLYNVPSRTAQNLDAATALRLARDIRISSPSKRHRAISSSAPIIAGAPSVFSLYTPIWGLGRVIAQEHPNFWGGLVDLDPGAPTLDAGAQLCDEIRCFGARTNSRFVKDNDTLVASSARVLRPRKSQRSGGGPTAPT